MRGGNLILTGNPPKIYGLALLNTTGNLLDSLRWQGKEVCLLAMKYTTFQFVQLNVNAKIELASGKFHILIADKKQPVLL